MAFLDELARFSQGNFLEGLAKHGAVLKEKEQNDFLVNKYEQFKRDKKELLSTTDEQLAELNKVEVKTDSEGKPYPPEVNASFNLLRAYDKMQKTTDLYMSYITPFAALNTAEGTNVANMLSKELASQLGIQEKTAKVPMELLEFKNAQETFMFNHEKLLEHLDAKKKNKQVEEVDDFILNLDLYKEMAKEDVWTDTKYGNKKLKDFITKSDVITRMVKERFPDMEEGVLSKAVNYMLSLKAIEGKQINPTDWAKFKDDGRQRINGFYVDEVNGAINTLKYISQDFRNLTPDLKDKFRTWVKDPQALQNAEFFKDNPGMEGRFADLYKVLGAGGTYDKAVGIVSAVFGKQWFDVGIEKKAGIDVGFHSNSAFGLNPFEDITKKDKNVVGGYEMKVPLFESKEIMRAKSGMDVINNIFDYDPSWEDRIAEQLFQEEQRRKEGSLLKEKSDLINNTFNKMGQSWKSGKE